MYVIKFKNLIFVCLLVLAAASGFIFCTVKTHTAATDTHAGIPVPIIMYHSILKSAAPKDKYVVTPQEFEQDLQYLREHGYTTILMQDLIDFCSGTKELPEKPVILTFDDGFFNNYTYVYPLLQQYGGKAVISIVGSYTDSYTESGDKNPNYAYLSWDECKEMSDSGMIEIQNHSDTFHSIDSHRSGSRRNKSESASAYEKSFKTDISALQDKITAHLGKTPTTYTYPFGMISLESVDYTKDLGFQATLSCAEGINYLRGDPDELFMLRRCIRPNNKSVKNILENYSH